jgi:hypothetical protein
MIIRSSPFSTFKECPRKAYFMYELGLVRGGSPSIDLLFGYIVHDGVDMLNKTGDLKDAFALIDQIQWPPAKKKTPGLAKTFLKLYIKKQIGIQKILSERDFRFFIGHHEWRGRWDGIDLLTEGLFVEENKTTRPRFFQPKPNDQLISYYKAGRLRFGDEVKGILINDFDVDKADIKQQFVRFTNEEVDLWEQETYQILNTYEAYRHTEVWPQHPSSCLLYGIDYPCPYIPLCSSPITASHLQEKLFVVNQEAIDLSW